MHVIAYVPTYTAVLHAEAHRHDKAWSTEAAAGHALYSLAMQLKGQRCVHGVPLAPLGSSIATRHQAPEALSTEHGQGTKPACPLARRNLAGSAQAGLKDRM